MHARTRVLAIEDDEGLGSLYRSVLGEEGYDVLLAREALEGMRLLEQGRPDVVLLDLMLPGDGHGILRLLRDRCATLRVPIIVVSGSVPPGRHVIAGVEAVVRKPFEFGRLIGEIEGVRHKAHVAR